jgi:rubrerythrin
MILSDDEVLHAWNNDLTWKKIKTSHLEANARIRILEVENQCLRRHIENCRLEAEGFSPYIHEATNAESRADRLAVIADALAAEAEVERFYHKRSHRTFIGINMALMKERNRAKEKLQELIDEIDRIANDYIPDNNTMAQLALEEMREAIGAALDEAKEK